ncbi:MAG: hypothetical protein SOT76_05165 [Eubacteriales bacterium]|nr:hypothetical protein [Eubacteriales bacterium]
MNNAARVPMTAGERVCEAQRQKDEAQRRLRAQGFEDCGGIACLDEVPAAAGGKLCLGMECLDRGLWELAPAIGTLGRLGIHSCRMQTGWARTEREKGVYDFSEMDREVRLAREAGFAPWLSLSYGNPVYASGDPDSLRAGGIGHVPIETQEERAAWQQYVAETVRRYRGQVARYEIWNEPDVTAFFPPKYGDWVKGYMELVRLTAPVIRENDPDAQIVACTGSADGLEPLLRAGMGEWVDVYSFHNYKALPESQNAAFRETLRQLRDRYAPGLGLIRGEAGCPSYNAPTSIGALHGMTTSETIQAKWAARHLIADFADPAIRETSYFHAYEFLHFSRQHHYYYGVLREDYSRKPAFETLQLLAHLFDGEAVYAPWRTLRFEPDTDNVTARVCSFERGGLPVLAYWQSEELRDDSEVVRVRAQAFPKAQWRRPVLLDTLTRRVYALSADEHGVLEAPLTGYAMILTEAEALAPFLDKETLDRLLRNARAEETEQAAQYAEG